MITPVQLCYSKKSLPQGVFVHWLKIHFSQVSVAWIHLKALRVFVESALRFGPITALKYAQSLSCTFIISALSFQVWLTCEVSGPPAPGRQEAIKEAWGRALRTVHASGPHCHSQKGRGLFYLWKTLYHSITSEPKQENYYLWRVIILKLRTCACFNDGIQQQRALNLKQLICLQIGQFGSCRWLMQEQTQEQSRTPSLHIVTAAQGRWGGGEDTNNTLESKTPIEMFKRIHLFTFVVDLMSWKWLKWVYDDWPTVIRGFT